MTIKMECVVKHIKKDYVELGKDIGICIAIIIGLVIGVHSLNVAFAISLPALSYIGCLCTAYNLFVVATAIIAGIFTIGIVVFFNGNDFVIRTKSIDESGIFKKEIIHETPVNSADIVLIAAGVECIPFAGYIWFNWMLGPFIDTHLFDITMILCMFVIYILIATPICCAIARCKE